MSIQAAGAVGSGNVPGSVEIEVAVPPDPIGRSGCVRKGTADGEDSQEEEAQNQGVPQVLLPIIGMLATMKGALYELVVGSGLSVLQALLEHERGELCGARYRHDSGRSASRAGYAPGELVLGGRRVQVNRPRVRSRDGQEVPLPSWERFASDDPLNQRAVEQMVLGVATRKYGRSLEPTPADVRARGTSKSAVSRRFVEATV